MARNIDQRNNRLCRITTYCPGQYNQAPTSSPSRECGCWKMVCFPRSGDPPGDNPPNPSVVTAASSILSRTKELHLFNPLPVNTGTQYPSSAASFPHRWLAAVVVRASILFLRRGNLWVTVYLNLLPIYCPNVYHVTIVRLDFNSKICWFILLSWLCTFSLIPFQFHIE